MLSLQSAAVGTPVHTCFRYNNKSGHCTQETSVELRCNNKLLFNKCILFFVFTLLLWSPNENCVLKRNAVNGT